MGEGPIQDAIRRLPEQGRSAALNNLNGEIYAAARSVLMGDRYLRDSMNQRMRPQRVLPGEGEQPRLPSDEHVWVNTWGFDGRMDGNMDVAPLRHSGSGVTAGIAHQFKNSAGEDGWFAGVNVAAEDARLRNHNNRNSRMDADSYSVGGYVARDVDGDVQLRAGATYSQMAMRTRREITVAGLESMAQAEHRGTRQQAFVEFSRDIAIGTRTMVAPYVHAAWMVMHTRRVRETDSLAALDVAAQRDSGHEVTIGVRGVWRLAAHKPTELVAEVAYARASGDLLQGTASIRYADGTGAVETRRSTLIGRDSGMANVILRRRINLNTTVSLGYHGQFGGGRSYHAGNVQFKRMF